VAEKEGGERRVDMLGIVGCSRDINLIEAVSIITLLLICTVLDSMLLYTELNSYEKYKGLPLLGFTCDPLKNILKTINGVVKRVGYRLAAKLMTEGTMHRRRGNTRASKQERREWWCQLRLSFVFS
jgi:hypothetical protein